MNLGITDFLRDMGIWLQERIWLFKSPYPYKEYIDEDVWRELSEESKITLMEYFRKQEQIGWGIIIIMLSFLIGAITYLWVF